MKLEEYLQLHPKKYLIFDLDCTLARLEINWDTYWTELFTCVKKLDPLFMGAAPTSVKESVTLVNNMIKRYGNKGKEIIDTFNVRFEHDYYSGYTPNPALLGFIRNNRMHFMFYMWTANSHATIGDFLKHEDLETSFEKIVTMDDVNYLKPNPEGFNKIYNPNILKSEYLMIGDRFTDKEAATAAGIDYYQDTYFSRQ